MKKYTTLFILLPLMALISFLFIIYNSPQHNNLQVEGEVFTKDRKVWEYLRFRDPETGKIPAGIGARSLEFVNSQKIHAKKIDKLNSETWNRRGPYEVGGRTRALAIDPVNENIIVAGAVSGGMWKSTDGGNTWWKTTTPEQLQSISCVAQDIREGKRNIYYAGTGEFWGNSADLNGNGIYKSTDGGESWFLLSSTSTNTPNSWDGTFEYVWSVKTNPAAPSNIDEVLACTVLGGVQRSTDGGETWKIVLGGYGNSYSYFTDIEITSSGVYYATLSQMGGTNGNSSVRGIYRSIDGENWVNITPANFSALYKRIVIGVAPSDENQVYFVAETPEAGKWTTNSQGHDLWHSLWKYTYKSGDGTGDGGEWEDRSEFLPRPEKVHGHMNSQGSYNLCIAVKPDDPETVFIGGVALYRSDDGWTSDNFAWIGGTCYDDDCEYHYRYPNHHADVHTLKFLPSDPTILFTGSDGGVHKTVSNVADRVEWISLNNGYYTTQFYTVAIDHGENNSDKVIGGLQDNGTLLSRENNINDPWVTPSKADGFCCAIPDGGDEYYTSQNSSNQPKIKIWRVVQNEDGSNKWQTRIDPIGGQDFIWNTPFILDPNNSNRMYLAGGNMVWRNNNLKDIPYSNSTDSISIGWDSLDATRLDNFPSGQVQAESVTALGISQSPANVLYYGTSYGNVFRVDNADAEEILVTDITGTNLPNGYVASVAVDPDDDKNVFVAYSNYNILSLFHSDDGGITWEAVSGNLEEEPNGKGAGPATLWIEILKINDSKLYLLGTSTGLFSSAYINGMNTVWTQESPDLIGNSVIDMIDARHSDGFVAVGSHGAGTFTAKITSLPEKPKQVTLLHPENDLVALKGKQLFKWQPIGDEIVTYLLQFSKDPNFETIDLEVKGIRGDSAMVEGFEPGYQNYYWRVIAIGTGGPSEPSDSRLFTTAIAPPQLIYPANNESGISINPILTWEALDNAVGYHFQITTNSNFDFKLIVNDTLSKPTVSVYNLKPILKHRWRVAAIDENGEGEFSEPFIFMADPANSVEKVLKGEDFYIYPNPSKGDFNISASNLPPGILRIGIYEQTGKFIQNIVHEYYEGGDLDLQYNAAKLSSGTYYIKINSGNFSHSKVLSLIK